MADSQITRNIDVVFCIDGTASMGPIMENVKENARRFYNEFVAEVTELGCDVGNVRVKLIIFRDYGVDEVPMDVTDWYELPDDDDLFSDKLRLVTPTGGGDLPENGLEAIYLAMKSDFVTGPMDRQAIVLITDADALEMDARRGTPKYPADMGTQEELGMMWLGMVQDPNLKLQQHNKRLVMFAPAGSKYEAMSSILEGAIFQPVPPGKGLEGMDFKAIVRVLAASVGAKN